MYYTEFARIQRMEKLLERLAYVSVGLDVFVAMATFLVTKGLPYSSFMLMLSGYLMAIEVGIAAVLFSALVALKHYRKLIDNVALGTFRQVHIAKYAGYAGKGIGIFAAMLRKFYQLFV